MSSPIQQLDRINTFHSSNEFQNHKESNTDNELTSRIRLIDKEMQTSWASLSGLGCKELSNKETQTSLTSSRPSLSQPTTTSTSTISFATISNSQAHSANTNVTPRPAAPSPPPPLPKNEPKQIASLPPIVSNNQSVKQHVRKVEHLPPLVLRTIRQELMSNPASQTDERVFRIVINKNMKYGESPQVLRIVAKMPQPPKSTKYGKNKTAYNNRWVMPVIVSHRLERSVDLPTSQNFYNNINDYKKNTTNNNNNNVDK